MNSPRLFAQCVRTIRPQYICRRCQLLHTTSRTQALFDENSFLGRMKNLIAPAKAPEKKEPDDQTDGLEARQKRDEPIAENRMVRIGENDYEIATTAPKDYQPAQTWEGLVSIGSEEWQKAQRDQGEHYTSFVPPKHVLQPAEWRAVLRHIVIEALIASKHALDICDVRRTGSDPWTVSSTAFVTIEDDAVHVRFAREGDEESLMDALQASVADRIPQSSQPISQDLDKVPTSEGTGTAELNPAEPLTSDYHTHDLQALLDSAATREEPTDSWLQVPLTDNALKFAIVKRITQLTGVLIPDVAISSSKDVQGLYAAGLVKPKPKKLAEMLQTLQGVSNITVHDKRWTAIDKDREVGRWKLIEEELIRRDLPIRGTRWHDAKLISQT